MNRVGIVVVTTALTLVVGTFALASIREPV